MTATQMKRFVEDAAKHAHLDVSYDAEMGFEVGVEFHRDYGLCDINELVKEAVGYDLAIGICEGSDESHIRLWWS